MSFFIHANKTYTKFKIKATFSKEDAAFRQLYLQALRHVSLTAAILMYSMDKPALNSRKADFTTKWKKGAENSRCGAWCYTPALWSNLLFSTLRANLTISCASSKYDTYCTCIFWNVPHFQCQTMANSWIFPSTTVDTLAKNQKHLKLGPDQKVLRSAFSKCNVNSIVWYLPDYE